MFIAWSGIPGSRCATVASVSKTWVFRQNQLSRRDGAEVSCRRPVPAVRSFRQCQKPPEPPAGAAGIPAGCWRLLSTPAGRPASCCRRASLTATVAARHQRDHDARVRSPRREIPVCCCVRWRRRAGAGSLAGSTSFRAVARPAGTSGVQVGSQIPRRAGPGTSASAWHGVVCCRI